MDVSIGILAHNEGKNIGGLLNSLLHQRLNRVAIKEIIVISSGSTDGTNQIVHEFRKIDDRIKFITERKRKGKVSAINRFLQTAKNDILVQISGDVLPARDSVEELCKPLVDPRVGIVACHPIPVDKMSNILGILINFRWEMQHQLSLLSPKVGEMIAFRNEIKKMPLNSVDEDYMAYMLFRKGFVTEYAPNSVVYNKGPSTISDFVKQRRRIYSGLTELHRANEFCTPTRRYRLLLRAALKTIPKYERHFFCIILAVILEMYSRMLGVYDFYIKKDKHIIWEVLK